MICIRVYWGSAASTTFFLILSKHRSGAHLNCINWVHNRMLLSTGQYLSSPQAGAGARREVREAYSYAGERAREHVLEQGKVGRERFIAIFPRISNIYVVFKGKKMALGEVLAYSYSSTGTAFGWAIGATATDPPPYVFDCRARMPTSQQHPLERGEGGVPGGTANDDGPRSSRSGRGVWRGRRGNYMVDDGGRGQTDENGR